ncbi:TonB-dependent receptor [uncultured Flavobacterium sp.]|uniref:SusC/RagA family TonB-linked outer membrane protein n=1 Tax=uncultured Flavobacterium sp. TaxID=165435 RepID=UPI0030CA3956
MTQITFAQERTVSGVVSDNAGLPLPGVSVLLKGTQSGTQTDFNGNYSIKASTGAVLQFSSVGMKTSEKTVGTSNNVDLVMQESTKTLEEVIVVGYGSQKKSEVTGSISKVKGSEIATLATPSFESQLAGRAAGVQITTQNGVLGEAPRIRIRGIGSISSGTYPLIVVDGIPIFTGDLGGYASTNSLGDINPSDIESIEILKDGSATAIYGSRAANGVVLITTKKGKGGRFTVNYNNYVGVASPVGLFDLLKTPDFTTISNEKRSNRGQADWAAGSVTLNTDWQKAVLRDNALQQDHSLSMSGSTDKANYYFSLGYSSQEGVTLPNDMTRYSIRANVDQKVKDWLTLGANISISKTQYDGLNTGGNSLSGNIFNATRQHPNVPIYDVTHPTGYNIDLIDPSVVGRWDNNTTIGDNLPNIMYVLDNNVFKSNVNRTIASMFADITILPSLKFKTQASVDQGLTDGFYYYNPVHGDGRGSQGRVGNNYLDATRWNWQNILSFNKTLANDHNIAVVLVNEYQKQKISSFYGGGSGLANEFFNQNLISGSYGTQSSGGSVNENGFISYAGRLNYNYKGKYFIQGSMRYDGISSLPKANKWGMFPGASVGWTVSKESFMESLQNVVSDFKLRASYAEVGNTSIGNYPYLGLYSNAKYADINGIAYSQMGNDQLKWETSTKYDIGFDASFYNGKFKLSFDYFLNNQDGLILAAPTPPSLGIPGNSVSKNIGSLDNHGYEFTAEATLINNENFNWSIDANLSLVGNKIKTLVAGQDITYENQILREGETMYALYGYKYYGSNPANGNPVYYKADGTLVQGNIPTSTYKVFDPANPGDIATASSLGSSDKSILGDVLPTYFGAFNTKMTYKNFDLSALIRFSGGNVIHNSTRRDLLNLNFTNNSTEILGRWQSVAAPGDGMTPRLWASGNTFVNLTGNATTRFVEDADYIKLDNISLGYSLPKSILDRTGINKLRIFVQGQNLFMITAYKGIDPEMESTGVDLNGTPRQRVFTMGVNLSL